MSEEYFLFALKTGGLGFITGFAIGYALKKISKILVIIIGVFLIAFQILVNNGFIEINWLMVDSAYSSFVDQENFHLSTIQSILMNNIPLGGSAVVGLILGLKKG